MFCSAAPVLFCVAEAEAERGADAGRAEQRRERQRHRLREYNGGEAAQSCSRPAVKNVSASRCVAEGKHGAALRLSEEEPPPGSSAAAAERQDQHQKCGAYVCSSATPLFLILNLKLVVKKNEIKIKMTRNYL